MNIFEAASTVSLKDVASSVLGYRIHTSGTMACPLHNEQNGKSFSVKENKFWKCFGKCGKHGDAIELVSVANHIERYEAAKLICETFKLSYDAPKPREDLPVIDYSFLKGNLYLAEKSGVELLSNKSVLDYMMKTRGFNSETLEKYMFGFMSKSTYDSLAVLVEKGVISDENYKAFARHINRLVIPLYNFNGKEVLGFVSRSLSKTDNIKYINDNDSSYEHGYHKRVYTYGMAQSQKKTSVVVVEGYLDCPSFVQLGVNTIAMGDCSLPESRFNYLVKIYSKLILGLDNDITGVYRSIELFKKFKQINFGYVLWPKGIKDANDCLKQKAMPVYGDYFEYIKNVWNNNINDVQTDYSKRMDFISKLRDSLSFVSYGDENYFVRKEIDKLIEVMLDY